MSFKVNNDLNNIQFNFHNSIHFFGCMLLAIIYDFQTSIALGAAWEYGDGWKPWYTEYKPTGHYLWDLFRENCLYSDKFSLQDLLIHDLCGAAIGHVMRMILLGFGVM